MERRILVVDDEKSFRIVAQGILERAGYMVNCCENGREALDYLLNGEDEKIDLVLSDLKMPEMPGIELVQQMRKNNITTPVVLTSGNAGDPAVRVKMEEVKPYDIVGKPFMMDRLLSLIYSYFAGKEGEAILVLGSESLFNRYNGKHPKGYFLRF